MAANEPPKPPYFLVFETSEGDTASPLTIAADERAAIPLFGSAERAREFLSSTDFGAGWEPVQVSPDKLVEILETHRDLVEYVAHDPPPAGEGGMRIRMGRLAELSDSLRERARGEMGLLDIGGLNEN